MSPRIAIAAFLGLTLATTQAFAGQIHNRKTSLEDVVARTELAVVVKVGDPAMTKVEIPVPGKHRKTKKSCGTYSYGAWRVEVVEVLGAAKRPPAPVGGTLVVLPGNTPGLIHLSQRACEEGIRKSPIWGRFHGAGAEPGSTRIVLLRWAPGFGWVEAVAGSWLLPEPRSKVEELLKRRPIVSTGGRDQWKALCVTDDDCALAPMTCAKACGACAGPKGKAVTRAAVWRFAADCAEAPKCAKCPPFAAKRKKAPVCRKMRCRRR